MSNWRDRTERDATLSHHNVINPDSINFYQTNYKKTLSNTWRYISILAVVTSAGLILTSLSLSMFLLSRNNTTSSQPETINSYRVVFICEKDNKGNSVINIADIDGGNKRPVILIEGNSEARCKEVAVELNKRIKADRENNSDSTNKSELKVPRPSFADPKSKKDRLKL